MSSKEYIQLVKSVYVCLRDIDALPDEFIDTLDQLQVQYKKYQAECEDYLTYPNYFEFEEEKKKKNPEYKNKIQIYKDEIIRICALSSVSCEVYEVSKSWPEFRRRFSENQKYIKFTISLDTNPELDITDLICFNKKSSQRAKLEVANEEYVDTPDALDLLKETDF